MSRPNHQLMHKKSFYEIKINFKCFMPDTNYDVYIFYVYNKHKLLTTQTQSC